MKHPQTMISVMPLSVKVVVYKNISSIYGIISMKKSLFSLSLMAVLGMTTVSAYAAEGTITFNGELTDTTCKVDVSGQGNDATVTLPTVSVNTLTQAGNTAGRTSFNLNVSDCEIGTANGGTKVAAFFQPGESVDLGTGRLLNTSGSATQVGLQLLDGSNSNSQINVGSSTQVTDMAHVNIAEDGTATLPYAVQYYADGKTTAGTVISSVVYNLQYQ